jgi:hypothetical protein
VVTLIDKTWFQQDNDDDAWQIANTAAVTPAYFAEVSCEGNRLFGVKTLCQREDCKGSCNGVLSACARATLWQYLYGLQQETEAKLGWTLTKRYVHETIPVTSEWRSKIQLTFGGVDRVNVKEATELIQEKVTVHPFVYRGTAHAVAGATHYELLVPTWLVYRPEDVLKVRVSTGAPIPWGSAVGSYPQRRQVGDEWYWVLGIPGGNATEGEEFDILDCQYAIVELPTDFCETDGYTPALVYPGTKQILPATVKTGDVDGVEKTYWFIEFKHLVLPQYQDDEVALDVCDLETHKLYAELDAMCFGETCQLAMIKVRCSPTDAGTDLCGECNDDSTPCEVREYPACATIIEGKSGWVSIQQVEYVLDDEGEQVLDANGCPTFERVDCCEDVGEPFAVEIYYHTDPVAAGISNTSAVTKLRIAIAARVAAEVPMITCGCNIECGWFAYMREQVEGLSWTREGSTVVALQYGNLRGQREYAEAMYVVSRNQQVGFL